MYKLKLFTTVFLLKQIKNRIPSWVHWFGEVLISDRIRKGFRLRYGTCHKAYSRRGLAVIDCVYRLLSLSESKLKSLMGYIRTRADEILPAHRLVHINVSLKVFLKRQEK